jgi:hypothetical protein
VWLGAPPSMVVLTLSMGARNSDFAVTGSRVPGLGPLFETTLLANKESSAS